MEREVWKGINRAANFLKHADQDPNDVLHGVQEELNDSMLLMACLDCQDIGYQLTPTMTALVVWHSVLHPELMDEDPFKKIVSEELIQSPRSASRMEQLKIGKLILEEGFAAE